MRNVRNVSVNGRDRLRPLDDLTDEELIAQLATGDERALSPLHARYAGLVFGIVAQSLDRPAAEEITQDVFFTVWQKAHTYDLTRGQVRPWLLRIAHSRMLNELRRRGRRPRLVFDPEQTQLGAIADNAPLPDEQVYRNDRRAVVVAAVAALPPAQRQALGLAYFHDLTQQQVATQLGVPLGTTKARIRSGMQRLRSTLPPVVATALVVGGLVAFDASLHQQQETLQRHDRALDVASSSGATVVHMSAAPGMVHQAWASQDGVWRSLATVPLDANGQVIVILDQPQTTALDTLQATLEPLAGSEIPTGPVLVTWPNF